MSTNDVTIKSSISLRIIPGSCHPSDNQRAFDWSSFGFIAYGCHSLLVILHQNTLSLPIRVWEPTRENIQVLSWNPFRSSELAFSDARHKITFMNGLTGLITSHFSNESSNQRIEWIASHHLLILSSSPMTLRCTSSETGLCLWKQSFQTANPSSSSSFCFGLSLDPFLGSRLALHSSTSLYLLTDFSLNSSSKVTETIDLSSEAKLSKEKGLKAYMKGLLTRSEKEFEIRQIAFSQSLKNHLFLLYSHEIHLFDLEIYTTVGNIVFDSSSNCPIRQILPTRRSDGLYILFSNGALSWRHKRVLEKSESSELFYDKNSSLDVVRGSKGSQILSLTKNPLNENNFALFFSEGRVVIGVKNSGILSLRSLHFGVSGRSPLLLKMCPPLTHKNKDIYKARLATSSHFPSGHIQIYDCSLGRLEKEFGVHSGVVKGLEWTSNNSLLSYSSSSSASSSASSSSLPSFSGDECFKNEIFITNVDTGRIRSLLSRSTASISMIRVSTSRRYFILSYDGAPFELWNLQTLTILRTMPLKFPPLTTLEWSPHKSSKTEEETFVFSDPENQLYHFSVEGNGIRNGLKLPIPSSSLTSLSTLSWKSEFLLRGDIEGRVGVWNIRKRSSSIFSLCTRSPILKIIFAPGKGNLKVLILSKESLCLRDVSRSENLKEVKFGVKDFPKVNDVSWASSDKPILSMGDGSLRITDLNFSIPFSFDYTSSSKLVSPWLLTPKDRYKLTITLYHQPWKKVYELNNSDEWPVSLPSEMKESLMAANSTLDRCLIASASNDWLIFSEWENDFWILIDSVLRGRSLSIDWDVFSSDYTDFVSSKLSRHSIKAETREEKVSVIHACLLNDRKEEALCLLLQTEISDSSFVSDIWKAALVSCLSTHSFSSDCKTSNLKLIATHFISEGKVHEGIQILCLLNKVYEASDYLLSHGEIESGWELAKLRCSHKDFAAIAHKYNGKLKEKSDIEERRRLKIPYILSYLQNWESLLRALLTAKKCPLAALLLEILEEFPTHQKVSLSLRQEVWFAYANYSFEISNTETGNYFLELGKKYEGEE